MSEYSIRKTTTGSGVTDIRFVDSTASTPTFSAVTVNTSLSANTVSATTFYGDGSNLTGISTQDTFATGGTYNQSSDVITITNNTGGTFDVTGITDTFVIAGTFNDATNTLSLLRNDGNFVNVTGVTDTVVTGYTYEPTANTFTIDVSNGSAYTATINEVTGLTVTNYIDYTTTTKPTAVSGRTYFDRDENALSYFPETPWSGSCY
jgi:hypothetical protein